jgi:hypothetical protein
VTTSEDSSADEPVIDPIGPPVIPTVRYGTRALALTGLVTGLPLAASVLGAIATWPWPPGNS